MAPLLSIIVPSFNQGRFIEECLAEPLRVADRGVEVLVFDGGSKDDTVDRLKRLDPEGRWWVSEKDRGQAHAINKGFARAKGKWLAFQNSDDFFLPGLLDRVLDVIERDSQAQLIVGGVAFVDEGGKPFRTATPKPILVPCLSQLNFLNNQAFFVRRDLFERVGGLDDSLQFCLDYDWFVRLFMEQPKVAYVGEIVGAQRYHGATKTSTMKPVHDREFAALSRKHFSLIQRLAGRVLLPPYRAYRWAYGRLANPAPVVAQG